MITTYWIKSQNLLLNADILKKFLLKHIKEKQWTFALCVVVFCIFLLNTTNSFVYFQTKKILDDCFCMKLRVAWISEFYLTVFESIHIYIYMYLYMYVYIYMHDSNGKGVPWKTNCLKTLEGSKEIICSGVFSFVYLAFVS